MKKCRIIWPSTTTINHYLNAGAQLANADLPDRFLLLCNGKPHVRVTKDTLGMACGFHFYHKDIVRAENLVDTKLYIYYFKSQCFHNLLEGVCSWVNRKKQHLLHIIQGRPSCTLVT